jgi:hypothetical protein
MKRAQSARTRRLPVDTARRLRAFLIQFQITDETEQKRLVRRFAATNLTADGAVQQAEIATAAWFADLLGLKHQELELRRLLAAGRLAWLSTGGPRRWPGQFLADNVPVALVAALRRAWPAPTPMVLKSPMAVASLDPVTLPAPALFGRQRTRPRAA